MPNIRDLIASVDDSRSELVHVGEWGCDIEIRSLTGLQRANFLKAASGDDGQPDFVAIYPELIIATSFDPEDGSKVFTPSDADFLNSRNSSALEQLASVAMRLGGMDKAEKTAAGKSSSPA
jgi:hypothetical protein